MWVLLAGVTLCRNSRGDLHVCTAVAAAWRGQAAVSAATPVGYCAFVRLLHSMLQPDCCEVASALAAGIMSCVHSNG